MKQQPEYLLQKAICQYLKMQYPEVLFMSDTVASVRLTMMQAVRNKAIQKEGFKCPDLVIFEPNKEYHALFCELKVKSPYKKDGTILANEHLVGQLNTIIALRKKGYHAEFCVGFDQTKEFIDKYLKII